jgi:cysteine desulfurase
MIDWQGEPIYMDYAATTPLAPEVAAAMQDCLGAGVVGNASSSHAAGRASLVLVERAREQLAELVHADPATLVWTSGATESDNLAIAGAARYRSHRGRHLITMRTEHKAVTDTFAALEREGYSVTWLLPDGDGLLPLADLEAAMREDTQLVSVMHVNNETGVIQDIRAIGEVCRRRDVLFHCDAAQSVGKLPIDLGQLPVDLMSMTAHKMYGPQGVGALYIADRPGCRVFPLLYGGSQERRLRPGTLPVHQIVGFGAAAAVAQERQAADLRHVEVLNERLWRGIRDLPGIVRNGSAQRAWPGILNVSAEGVEGESLLLALEPLCVATGSACNSASREPSHVLRALGRDDRLAQSAIRFSFGRGTEAADIDAAVGRYVNGIKHLLGISPPHAA